MKTSLMIFFYTPQKNGDPKISVSCAVIGPQPFLDRPRVADYAQAKPPGLAMLKA